MSAKIHLKKLLTPERIEEIVKKEEKNIFGFFIKHHRFTYLILAGILAMGFYAVLTLPRESDPEIAVPYAMVNTPYPGANPTDVEELVTSKLEDRVKNLDKLKTFRSSSGVGFSSIFIEFAADADITESVNKLKDAVDLAKTELPDAADDPIVTQLNITDQSLISYSLEGEGYDEESLKGYAEKLQERFEAIKGVDRAPIIGGLTREFQVIVDQTRLASFNLSLGQVVSSISRTNVNLPAGSIEVDGFKYNVRVQGKFNDAETLANIIVARNGETPIYLRDVARIEDTFTEKQSASRIGVGQTNPKPTVSLNIFKQTGANTLDIVDATHEAVAELKDSSGWPANLDIIATNDFSVFIRDDLKTLGQSGIQTMVLIVVILALAVGLRAAIITSLSVPIAFLMAFIILLWQDMTVNGMVLFSLVLSLGLMVDNSIVIIEGISEYMGKYKLSAYHAGLLSVWNYRWPVIAGTLTTVAAFAPMLLVSGILGEYLAIIPITLMATLLSSLAVALVIIPVLASKLIGTHHTASEAHYGNGDSAAAPQRSLAQYLHNGIEWVTERYGSFMGNIIHNKKQRRRLILAAWAGFLIAALMPVFGLMKIEMFPQVDIDYIFINIELPAGSVLEKTSLVATAVERIITENIPETSTYVTNLGSSVSVGTQSGSAATHLASITVNLNEDRERESFAIANAIRPLMAQVQGGRVTVEELSAGPPTGSPIEARVFGDDLKTIANLSHDVKRVLTNIDGVINVRDNLEDATGEFTFAIDRQKANYYGLSVADVAGTLRNAIYGTKASEVLLNGEDVDITVKYAKNAFTNVSDLENLLITTPQGATPLKNIASVTLEPSLLSIQHREGENVVIVSADIAPDADLQTALAAFDEERAKLALPGGTRIEIGGEVEDIDQSFRETFLSMIIAVILIAMILVLQFNSFKQPFIILFSLPLAIPGVILSLTAVGQPFSFPAFIGIVALAGIAVNDAIVLIDKINKNIKALPVESREDEDFYDAIIDGGVSRLQPIILTTLTTIAGILPLYFANEVWRGLSVTVAGGLAFSTLLTLIVVPSYYAVMCKKDFNRQKSENSV